MNKLIQDGARPVMDVRDILEALNLFLIPQHVEMQAVLPDNDEERKLLKLMSHATLMMMELKGMIRQVGGMQYVLAR